LSYEGATTQEPQTLKGEACGERACKLHAEKVVWLHIFVTILYMFVIHQQPQDGETFRCFHVL